MFLLYASLTPDSGVGKKYKWSTSLDSQFVFDFAAARPHQHLCAIQWDDNVKGIQRSESGSEVHPQGARQRSPPQGVFFVDTADGALVIKAGCWGDRMHANHACRGRAPSPRRSLPRCSASSWAS